jgi:predicted DNA-binding transcriptional regulator YafY
MKIDRMIAIIVALIRKNRIQAKELAEMFDVSVRTIYRDIEAINQAGIPIITYQGINGGVSIAEGYKLEKNVLSNSELAAIVTALQGIPTAPWNINNQILLEKLKSVVPPSHLESFNLKTQQFFVDLSPWGSNASLERKIDMLKQAIDISKSVEFNYCSIKGELTLREVEPHTLILKAQKWYLYAFCKNRNDFRMFKLSRIKDIRITDAGFVRREISLKELPWNTEWADLGRTVELVLKFDSEIEAVAGDWFGFDSLEPCDDGRFMVKTVMPEDNWLLGFVLSFGNHVEVVEPEHLREKIKGAAKEIWKIYEK